MASAGSPCPRARNGRTSVRVLTASGFPRPEIVECAFARCRVVADVTRSTMINLDRCGFSDAEPERYPAAAVGTATSWEDPV
jgi:hypothetical protein